MKKTSTKAAFALAWLMAVSGPGIAQDTKPAPAGGPPSVEVVTPVRADGNDVAGLVQAGEETTLSSQMAGKVKQIRYGLGEVVKAGARLIEFDCSEQNAQLAAADAEYRGAREAHLSRLRLQSLGAAGELEVTMAAAAAEKARSLVDLRRTQVAYCAVNAPFSGRVTRVRVKVAESVSAGQALIDFVNPASLKVQMFVPAGWSGWLKPGTPFDLKVKETGRTYQGRVSKLNARIEGVSQQLEIEGRIDGNSAGLMPGMVGGALFVPPRAQ